MQRSKNSYSITSSAHASNASGINSCQPQIYWSAGSAAAVAVYFE
jgi:hypothetical protein